MKEESMEIDNPDESNPLALAVQENGLVLHPVHVNDSGVGLPYAPINWPNPGDNWAWKVGRRVAQKSGSYLDRYLYLPRSLQTGRFKKRSFASRLSVKQYIRTEFPDADVDAFFASFSWKVPSINPPGGDNGDCFLTTPEEIEEHSETDSQSDSVRCIAGNKMCNSIIAEEGGESPVAVMPCDICCSETGFCRDCCCILCCKTVNSANGGYSYFKCEAKADESSICGHVAHIDCALRAYMAGTVGGSIGLDAEYYCRRCDARTDLIPHVSKLIQTCESIDSKGEVEKMLNLGVCVLRGSQKASAKRLLVHIEFALSKLKSGTYIEEISKVGDKTRVISPAYHGSDTLEATDRNDPVEIRADSQQVVCASSDYQIECLRLEDEVYQVLQKLRKSQESEYKLAEETLYAQKNYLLNLFQQLDKERSELTRRTSLADSNTLLDAVLNRMDQIKREVKKLKDMGKVAEGFGKTPKDILKEHFGLED